MSDQTGQHLVGETPEKVVFPASANYSFNLPLNPKWEPTKEGDWRTPTQEVQDVTSITQYNFFDYDGPTYRWQLTIRCKKPYHFYFTDDSPDTYGLNVDDVSKTHSVWFNSDKPNIATISGHD